MSAFAEGPRGPVRGVCTNISLGGLFLEGTQQLPVKAMTTVTVEHPTLGKFSAQAEVMHHAFTPKGMGLKFMRLEPTQLAVLQKLIASTTSL